MCLKKEEGCNHIVAEEVVLTRVLVGTVIAGVQSVVTQFAFVKDSSTRYPSAADAGLGATFWAV
jgi:hypothetical protein